MAYLNLRPNRLLVLALGLLLGCAEVRTYRETFHPVRGVNRFALWCIEKGLWEEARVHLERALSQDSTSAALYNNLGILYEHMGRLEEAEAAYRKAVDLDPKCKLYRWNYSRFQLLRRGLFEEASPEPEDSLWTPIEEPELPLEKL